MVSRIAVVALVAIVACPILLGYAFNLDQTTVTDYRPSDESTNVSKMLENSADYTIVRGDTYSNNTKFLAALPNYKEFTNTKTSLELTKAGSISANTTQSFSGFNIFYYQVYSGATNAELYYIDSYNVEHNLGVLYNLNMIYYNGQTPNKLLISTDFEYNKTLTAPSGYYSKIVFHHTTTGIQLYDNGGTDNYVNFAAGFDVNVSKLDGNTFYMTGQSYENKSFLISINLDSVTGSNYQFGLYAHYAVANYLLFEKTTTDGNVKWTVKHYSEGVVVKEYDLYYDPTVTNNTYQVYATVEGKDKAADINTYSVELRYVGEWPVLIGEANYYTKYSFEFDQVGVYDKISSIGIKPVGETTTPVMRIDDVTYKSLKFGIIEDRRYNPSGIKDNPITTFNKVARYGTAIVFGGTTFTVNDGKITLDGHLIPVEGLSFSSILNPDTLGYDNMIGNTLISSTAEPSKIEFSGRWSVDVSTAEAEEYTRTVTTWTPGHFGWDGIDQNFLIVGLLTSIGTFIALGIYIRKTGKGLWPLLIVCGGAAMLFFCML